MLSVFCDSFLLCVVAQDRRSEDLELLVVLANILGLLVAGPPVGSRSVYFCVCGRHGQRQRWSVCFWFCSRPEAKAVPTRADV